MTVPRHLFQAWPELRRKLRRARRLAFFTDFDGTLVPIRSRPDEVRLPAAVRGNLARLRRRGAVVGVISGRRLAGLRRLVRLRGLWYAGAHGFVLCGPDNRVRELANPGEKRRIVRARNYLARRLQGLGGIVLEPKGATLAVHYRNASPAIVRAAHGHLRQVLQQEHGLRLLAGKKVWELLPDAPADKGKAVKIILAEERRRRHGSRWAVFYLGDDTTDERVFEGLKGITVRIGRTRRTAARFFLRSPAEAGKLLERLAQEWKGNA